MSSFIENIDRDEIRSGFLVTTDRKKLWNRLLQIWEHFDSFCQKHNIKYFADSGTLLGAVRHGGFIPWDDDLDVVVMRPDYEKLKQAAADLSYPYFLQTAYSERGRFFSFAKIMDESTSAIEYPNQKRFRQGIFIDIFPFDDVPDGRSRGEKIFSIQTDLWLAISQPQVLQEMISSSNERDFSYAQTLKKILSLPLDRRMAEFEAFNAAHYGQSDKVNFLYYEMARLYPAFCREWFASEVYLPFETVKLPCPVGYDAVLRNYFDDYQKFVRGVSLHKNIIFSTDIPYTEYFRSIT